jgi:hypothetical protein
VLLLVTVAVKVTVEPGVAGFGDAVSATVLGASEGVVEVFDEAPLLQPASRPDTAKARKKLVERKQVIGTRIRRFILPLNIMQ